jgi:hypothetical protein
MVDLNTHINFFSQYQFGHLIFIGHVICNMENIVAGKAVGKFVALRGFGIVQNSHANIADIIIYDIAENEHLDKGKDKEQRAVSLIAEKLNKFFAHQFSYSEPAHRPSFFNNL